MGNLTELEILDVRYVLVVVMMMRRDNKLIALPTTLAACSKLTSLIVTKNLMKNLPISCTDAWPNLSNFEYEVCMMVLNVFMLAGKPVERDCSYVYTRFR